MDLRNYGVPYYLSLSIEHTREALDKQGFVDIFINDLSIFLKAFWLN